MKQIYASKLYRSSKRKAQITAAIASASNLALVQQLASDLDEEYKQQLIEQQAEAEARAKENAANNDEGGGGSAPDVPGSFSSGFSGGGSGGSDGGESFNPETDLVEYPEDLDEGNEAGEPAAEDEQDSLPEDEISESVKIEGSTSCIQTMIEELKSTLNLVDDTKGVSRTSFKENEVWIYYNDAVNLNNIMTDVIDSVSRLHPTDLEFNRLARSDNAIVFDFRPLNSAECDKEDDANK